MLKPQPSPSTRISPDSITMLGQRDIFVFGSNLAGAHGAGAARSALKWGAVYGIGRGLRGRTYAIPTKDEFLVTRSLLEIFKDIEAFVDFTKNHPNLLFQVTQIGCGLAGYKPEQIAPLFSRASIYSNIYLPKRFWEIINNQFRVT